MNKQQWISNKIGKLISEEGYEKDQATAIAYSMWDDRQHQVGLGGFEPQQYAVKPRDNTFVANQELSQNLPKNRPEDMYDVPPGYQYLMDSSEEAQGIAGDIWDGLLMNESEQPQEWSFGMNRFSLNPPQQRQQNDSFGDFPDPLPPVSPQLDPNYGRRNVPQQDNTTDTGQPEQRPKIQAVTAPDSEIKDLDVGRPEAKNYTQEDFDNYFKTHEVEDNTLNPPNPPNYQTFNPYGGVDIPTAASVLGQSIESGNTLGTAASGLKLGAGLGRNIAGAMGAERRNQYIKDQYDEKQRQYLTQENNATYMQDGGVSLANFSLQPPNRKKPLTNKEQAKVRTGEFVSGASQENTSVNPNSNVEKGEYIVTPQGEASEVIGQKHSKGGEEVELQKGDMVISDHLKVGGENAKTLRDQFDIKLKAKDTYATAVDKVYSKIGIKKLTKEEEKVNEKIEKQEKKDTSGTTKSLNLQFLKNQKQKIKKEKEKLEPKRKEVLASVFKLQEEKKATEQKQEQGNEFQDGGKRAADLSPYAYIMFTGTPEEKSFVKNDMADYFNPDGERFNANRKKETADEHLERMRPIYEKMEKEGTLENYEKLHAQALKNNKKEEGVTSTAPKTDNVYKEGGLFTDTGSALAEPVKGSRNKYGYYGDVTPEDIEQLKSVNSWYDWDGVDLTKKADVLDFQKEFNKAVPNANSLKEDGLAGEQFISATRNMDFDNPLINNVLRGNYANTKLGLTPMDNNPLGESSPQKESIEQTVDKTSNNGDDEGLTEGDETDHLNYPLLPDQYVARPSSLDPSLKVNRQYDRVRGTHISPEQIIQENQRQAQAAYQQANSLPDSQRASAIAQINANTQNANARAVQQAQRYNAQVDNKVESQNVNISNKEADVRAEDALSYEKRTRTAEALTDEERKQYLDYMNKLNTAKFNDVRKQNIRNNLFDNYVVDANGNIVLKENSGIEGQQYAQLLDTMTYPQQTEED